MPETIKKSMMILNSEAFTDIAYGINGAGGGGNVKELYNPNRQATDITGLVEELGTKTVPLYSWEELNPESAVCCIARLGSPGAKADQFASEAAQAVFLGLARLAEITDMPFPKAIFPVEATAGQMARAVRAALAASQNSHTTIGILDGDVCGGMAVPAVPLAFGIKGSLKYSPQLVLIELETENGQIIPKISPMRAESPVELEKMLREKASQTEMGAIWFAWLMARAGDFAHYFTPGAVTSSIRRGEIVRGAIERRIDPAEALLEAGEINGILVRGEVVEVKKEKTPGFAQFSYQIRTAGGQLVNMAARNEYIVVWNNKSGEIIGKAPLIIAALGDKGPIQSHVLQAGQKITIVSANPQALINRPELEKEWLELWKQYWEMERKKETWPHPY